MHSGSNLDGILRVLFFAGVFDTGNALDLLFEFQPTALGLHDATLQVFTDQDASFGAAGTIFSFSLQGLGTAAVPEPSTFALAMLGLYSLGQLGGRRRRR